MNNSPGIVAAQDWKAALDQLRKKEKALTKAQDSLAAERRSAPRMAVEKTYRFRSTAGELTLEDLFEKRRQLIVYHHMLKPDDPSPCSGCGMVGDQIPHLAHLHARNTSLVFVSQAPAEQIDAFRERMGWRMPWYETCDNFNADFDVTNGFGLNVFIREKDVIQRSYFTTGRGVETLGTPWTLLDITPLGRQESWEVSPTEVEHSKPYQWWRLHDEY